MSGVRILLEQEDEANDTGGSYTLYIELPNDDGTYEQHEILTIEDTECVMGKDYRPAKLTMTMGILLGLLSDMTSVVHEQMQEAEGIQMLIAKAVGVDPLTDGPEGEAMPDNTSQMNVTVEAEGEVIPKGEDDASN